MQTEALALTGAACDRSSPLGQERLVFQFTCLLDHVSMRGDASTDSKMRVTFLITRAYAKRTGIMQDEEARDVPEDGLSQHVYDHYTLTRLQTPRQ